MPIANLYLHADRHLLQPKGRRLRRKKQDFDRFKEWIRCQLAL